MMTPLDICIVDELRYIVVGIGHLNRVIFDFLVTG